MNGEANTLKKRLDEKDIQAETFTDDIEQLRTRTDAQKTKHEELKSTLVAKDSELEDMLAKQEAATKDTANKMNAELSTLKKRLDGKDEGDDSTTEKLTSIQERLKAQNQKTDEVKAALTARDDELEAKVMEVDERLSKSVGEA